MKSKAHIRSHPLHPMLVAFPLAFFIGAFIADVICFFTASTEVFTTAGHLTVMGLIGGVVASVPGILDLLYTVPPHSSAKERGLRHGMLNGAVMILFGIALALRQEVNHIFIVLIETVACALLFVAGWMGGTLVHRNQIGVYNRYAESGKWRELRLRGNADRLEVPGASDLLTDQMMLLHIGKKRIVLGRTQTGFVAFDDRCTHKGGSLAGGTMICGTVQCPWHGSQFDTHTGQVKAGPANAPVQTYPVFSEGNRIFLRHRSGTIV